MTELKTLKDLDVFIEHDRTMWNAGVKKCMDEAKQLAIKWVKSDTRLTSKNNNKRIYRKLGGKAWVEFFNITEDDLK